MKIPGWSTEIKRIFIANRGEVAARIAQSAFTLNIETVTVASKDTPPLFLLPLVSKIHYVNDKEIADLYLDAKQLVSIARMEGCDAVHPGYGFLAENADFAETVVSAGLVWIGPDASTVRAMGNKNNARQIAEQARVPVIDGICLSDVKNSSKKLEEFRQKNSPPFIIKASAGGGGKGMRLVHTKDDLLEAAIDTSREAKSLYQNGEIIIEKFVAEPRHIEVQIMGDKHGNLIVLGDRECSIQRRFQKIIEEAPAPQLSSSQRSAMHQAALALGRHVSYYSAGTIEFLLDSNTGAFYFLEMNTRLQVEHTVTEEVTGVDLVAWQIRIAQDETLDMDFAEEQPRSHSIQARIYAEDAARNFLPMPGRLVCFKPFHGCGIRWEIGCDQNDYISPSFDPMLAKLIATGENRGQAIKRLNLALSNTFVAGIETNTSFLKAIISQKKFSTANLTTNFIAENSKDLLAHIEKEKDKYKTAHQDICSFLADKFSGFCNNKIKNVFSKKNILQVGNIDLQRIEHIETERIRVGSGIYEHKLFFSFAIWEKENNSVVSVSIDGYSSTVENSSRKWDCIEGDTPANELIAPVPGKVTTVNIKAGDIVADGTTCLTIESMKMEFSIKSSGRGKVSKVLVKSGDMVKDRQTLVTLEGTL